MPNRLTNEQYIQRCKINDYDLPIEYYRGSMIKIKHKCSKGHIYLQALSSHLKCHGCPYCKGVAKKTPKQYKQECINNHLDLPIEDYKGAKVPILHYCNTCYKKYKITPDSHLNKGAGCYYCLASKNEKHIMTYLDKNHIEYKFQWKPKDFVLRKSHFDFYLPKQNTLIEFQGEQHYKQSGYSKHNLSETQDIDNIKLKYAKSHGFNILTPDYHITTQEDINKYLHNHLITTQ